MKDLASLMTHTEKNNGHHHHPASFSTFFPRYFIIIMEFCPEGDLKAPPLTSDLIGGGFDG